MNIQGNEILLIKIFLTTQYIKQTIEFKYCTVTGVSDTKLSS